MKVIKQLLEVNVAFVHEIIASWLYRNQTHCLGVMNGSLSQIDECRYGTTQVQQRMHLHTAFVMMQTSPWTKLKAQLDSAAIKGIHDTVHVKTGRLILVKFSCPSNKNLTEIMVYTPLLGLIDMGQGGRWIYFIPLE